MSIDLNAIKECCQKHWDLGYRDGVCRYFVKMSDDVAVKIGTFSDVHEFTIEYEWLKYLAPRVDPTKAMVPMPLCPLVKHGRLTLLVMQYVPGRTIQQNLDDGLGFSVKDALRVCDAYLSLRAIKPKGDELYPAGPWPLRGHIFQPDSEGGLNMKSRSDFQSYMNDRLTRAHNRSTTIPECEVVLSHGDLSPKNVMFMPDGRVGFLGLVNAVWGPAYWEHFALFASHYALSFTRPMQEALDRRGLGIDPETHLKLWKLMVWHGTRGPGLAR